MDSCNVRIRMDHKDNLTERLHFSDDETGPEGFDNLCNVTQLPKLQFQEYFLLYITTFRLFVTSEAYLF